MGQIKNNKNKKITKKRNGMGYEKGKGNNMEWKKGREDGVRK
jgi:hypothetical protein